MVYTIVLNLKRLCQVGFVGIIFLFFSKTVLEIYSS